MKSLFFFIWVIYGLARPDDEICSLDIILIVLLLIYNVTGGLLPDPKMPGSYFLQESIAYGTGFITPCYFPYYVYRGFCLEKMKFHAYKGVFFFLVLPYLIFVTVFRITGSLNDAKYFLVLPVLYAVWVLISVWKAVHFKYRDDFSSYESREEIIVLFLSLTPWIALPVIAYYDWSQMVEAPITNGGFLLLFTFHLSRQVKRLRQEHKRLIESEKKMQTWNEELKAEVEKRTKELERKTKEERFNENCERYKLSKREKEISKLICEGKSYKEIGEQLFIAERTVAKHAQNIFEKVSVSNKMELCQRLEEILNST